MKVKFHQLFFWRPPGRGVTLRGRPEAGMHTRPRDFIRAAVKAGVATTPDQEKDNGSTDN